MWSRPFDWALRESSFRVNQGFHGRRATPRWRGLIVLGIIAGTLLLSAGAALAEGEAVFGTIETREGELISGVTITVSDESGAEIATLATDDLGEWRVELPGPGEYTLSLDPSTLPDGVALRDEKVATTTLDVRSGGERRVLFPLGEAVASVSTFESIAQRTVTGLKFGLIIAITSVGLSLVFGTTGLINFAHGELVTFGAIVAWFLNVSVGMNLILAGILATVVGVVGGASLESGIFARLRKRRIGGFQFLVITIGLSLLLQHLLLIWFGSDFRPYGDYARQPTRQYGPININTRDIIVMALSVLVLVALATMLQRTRMGKAMRAVSDNRDLAEASGVNVNRVTATVWALAGGLAAIGGVFLGLVSTVQYLMGFQLLLLMFAGIILGGLGTAYGAMVGGLVIGLVSEVSTVWLRVELKSVWALAALIVVLLVRPQGILGVRERFG
jgi:neutral amino acid transport system permease protein